MSPLAALFKKELVEILGDRSARRGGLVQAIPITLVLGVLLPYQQAAAWAAGSLSAIMLFAMMPGLPAAILAADAFAGERERRTLATLLASPVPESTLVFGKWLAAVSFGMVVAIGALVAAHLVVFAKLGVFVVSSRLIVGALLASLGSTSLVASVTVIVSMNVGSARGAQQIASVLSLVLFFGGGLVAAACGLTLTWPTLVGVALGTIVLGVVVLEIASALFQRDRLLEPDSSRPQRLP